jgi:hypothetical protein
VHAGTVIGRIAKTDALAPHLNFAIRPAGKDAPSIDPKPILDGWKLLEATAIYRAHGKSPLTTTPGASNVVADLLMPTTSLARNVLADPRLSLPDCGRQSIRAGAIDRRVLATLEYLADNGFRLSVAGLRCDRATGDAKAAQRRTSPADSSTGQSFEVTKIDRMRIGGRHSSPTLPDSLVKTALRLQGLMAPQKIVSSRKLPGQVSFSRPGHHHDILISFAALRAMGYQDPFVNATQGRTDMGVDYVGSGPINAIGNARILQIGAPGWPNGGAGPAAQGVLYQLLDGPRSGQIVYVYEGLTPTVHAGQQVVAGQQIARFYPGSSIEIGFADAAGAPLSHWIYTEGMVTSWGRRMAAFLASIGAPGPALQQFSGALSPSEWKQVDRGLHKIQSPTVEPSAPDG